MTPALSKQVNAPDLIKGPVGLQGQACRIRPVCNITRFAPDCRHVRGHRFTPLWAQQRPLALQNVGESFPPKLVAHAAYTEPCLERLMPFSCPFGGWLIVRKRCTLHPRASLLLVRELPTKRECAELLVLDHWQHWCRQEQSQTGEANVCTA